jgi:hypothetical protein
MTRQAATALTLLRLGLQSAREHTRGPRNIIAIPHLGFGRTSAHPDAHLSCLVVPSPMGSTTQEVEEEEKSSRRATWSFARSLSPPSLGCVSPILLSD